MATTKKPKAKAAKKAVSKKPPKPKTNARSVSTVVPTNGHGAPGTDTD